MTIKFVKAISPIQSLHDIDLLVEVKKFLQLQSSYSLKSLND
jgi:hypothetical protein